MLETPNATPFIPPVTSVFSAMGATFHVIENHWKPMVKRQSKYVGILIGTLLIGWFLAILVPSVLEMPIDEKEFTILVISVIFGVIGIMTLSGLLIFLFLINSSFATKIVQGEPVSHDEVIEERKKRPLQLIVSIVILSVYGMVLVIIASLFSIVLVIVLTFALISLFLGVFQINAFMLLLGILIILGLLLLYFVPPFMLMFPILAENDDLSIWKKLSRAFQLAKGNRIMIFVTHFIMNLVVSVISNLVQNALLFVTVIGTLSLLMLVNALQGLAIITPTLEAIIFFLGVASFIALTIGTQVLINSTVLGTFYGAVHGVIILKNENRPLPWKKAMIIQASRQVPPTYQYPQPHVSLPSVPQVPPEQPPMSRSTMFCRYCGQEIPVESIYCQECGKKLK